MSDVTSDHKQTASTDVLLLPFLRAAPADLEAVLTELITEHVQPVIQRTIRQRLATHGSRVEWNQDAEDLYDDALLQLIAHLYDFKRDPAANPISDLHGYAAVIAHNAYHHYLRKKHPQRSRLRNRIRYLLTHRRKFFMAPADRASQTLCGFAGWRHETKTLAPSGELRKLQDNPALLSDLAGPTGDLHQASLDDLLTAIFEYLNAPVLFDSLVDIVARFQGIKDQPAVTETDHERPMSLIESMADPSANPATVIEQHSYVQRLWSEICELPLRQRMALLLNPGEVHEDIVILLLHTGAASLRQIAAALAIQPDEFAQLWRQLPFDDLTIAARLGITRQQVINLRKSARERLGRRMERLSKRI